MYSSEIEMFLREHSYVVTPEECSRIVDPNTSPQITNIKFFCENNRFVVNTEDGYCFKFQVIPN